MSPKPTVRRRRARQDIEAIVDYYRQEASEDIGPAFLEALENAFDLVSRYPVSGSVRYAHELGLPGLRSIVVRPFPYLIFYVEHDVHVEIWRVLHTRRDIPAWIED